MRQPLLLLIALACASEALAQKEPPKPAVPFVLPTPEGWRTETLSFPLEFAPELPYQGLEELRFSPGMFKAGSEDFWSYAFVFWLEGEVPFTAARLNATLETYLEGLSRAVEEKNEKFDPKAATVTASLMEVKATKAGPQRFEGTVKSYDPFATHKPLTLNLRVHVFRCPAQGRMVAFFQASPQPASHKVWETLERIREGFRCSKEGSGNDSAYAGPHGLRATPRRWTPGRSRTGGRRRGVAVAPAEDATSAAAEQLAGAVPAS